MGEWMYTDAEKCFPIFCSGSIRGVTLHPQLRFRHPQSTDLEAVTDQRVRESRTPLPGVWTVLPAIKSITAAAQRAGALRPTKFGVSLLKNDVHRPALIPLAFGIAYNDRQ